MPQIKQEQDDCRKQQGCHWSDQDQCCYDKDNKRWSKENWEGRKNKCSEMRYRWDDDDKCCYSNPHNQKWWYDDDDCNNAPHCYQRSDCDWDDEQHCCWQNQNGGRRKVVVKADLSFDIITNIIPIREAAPEPAALEARTSQTSEMRKERQDCQQQQGYHWSDQDQCCYDKDNKRWSKGNWQGRRNKCSQMHYRWDDDDKCCYSQPHNEKWWFDDDDDCNQAPPCYQRADCDWDDQNHCCWQRRSGLPNLKVIVDKVTLKATPAKL